MTAMISPDEALQLVLQVGQRLPPVTVHISDALGNVLAQDVLASDPLPPYRVSAKDGYAVVASNGPAEYPVIGESRGGNDGVCVHVTPGTVVYVTTGGSSKGCDIEKDAVVLQSGDKLGASEIGLLAAVGVTNVKVYPTPTVAVLSIGDELVEATTRCLNSSQIRDSNRAMILAAASQHHCKVLDIGIARDDEEELESILDTAISSGANTLLTSGGVSMGDKDFVKPLLEKKGTVYFNKEQ